MNFDYFQNSKIDFLLSEILQPQEALQSICYKSKRHYKRDTTATKGVTSEILQPQKVIQR